MKKNQLKLRKEVIASLNHTQMNVLIGGYTGDEEAPAPTLEYYSCFCHTNNEYCCSGDCVAESDYFGCAEPVSDDCVESGYFDCEEDIGR